MSIASLWPSQTSKAHPLARQASKANPNVSARRLRFRRGASASSCSSSGSNSLAFGTALSPLGHDTGQGFLGGTELLRGRVALAFGLVVARQSPGLQFAETPFCR